MGLDRVSALPRSKVESVAVKGLETPSSCSPGSSDPIAGTWAFLKVEESCPAGSSVLA